MPATSTHKKERGHGSGLKAVGGKLPRREKASLINVKSGMLGHCNDLKILNAIIKLVTVNMMNYLSSLKSTSEVFFHNKTVGKSELHLAISHYVNSLVTFRRNITSFIAWVIYAHPKPGLGFLVGPRLYSVCPKCTKNCTVTAIKSLCECHRTMVDAFKVKTTDFFLGLKVELCVVMTLLHIPYDNKLTPAQQ